MFGYRVPAPDEAMLVSGGKHGAQGAPFRVIVGHGAFINPFFRKARYLTLAMQEAEVAEQCVTKQGIALNVRAVIAFKVGNDEESIVNAGQRFLSDQRQMPVLTGRIFAGHLRSIVGSMTVEEIITERQKLASEVLDGSKAEMATIGLIVDSLQIQSIDDMGSGYIAAMAAPNNAAIQRQAKIAQAQADQAAVEAQQQSARKQAEFARDTAVAQAQFSRETQSAQAQAAAELAAASVEAQQASARKQAEFARDTAVAQAQFSRETLAAQAQAEAEVGAARAGAQTSQAGAEQDSVRQQAEFARKTAIVQAQAKGEVDKARAAAEQAGPLAEAEAQRAVTTAQAELARQQADLRQQQLVAEVIRPAEAEAERVRILAEAEANRTRIQSEALASSNRVALDQALINQLPAIVKETAAGLAGANVTVLNGADGLGQIAASLVSQGLSILDTLRTGLPARAADGKAPAAAAVLHPLAAPPGEGETSGSRRAVRMLPRWQEVR